MIPLAPRVPAPWRLAQWAAARQPPRRPRQPLCRGEAVIGSVEEDFFDHPGLAAARAVLRRAPAGWAVTGADLTESLARIAHALREAGLAGAWRDEALAVRDAQDRVLATIERAAVRPLGIATRAVYLAGRCPNGHHWIQRRALDKATDPGRWDTLVGGMVPASDAPAQALVRETWEEAGLHLDRLEALRPGGHFTLRRPSPDGGGAGYMVERIDWWQARVPDGQVPVNQDGEVSEFRRMDDAEVAERLVAGEFTLEAGLVLAGGEPPP